MKKLLILTLIIALLTTLINAEAYTESTIYCDDADTLIENITVYVGDNTTTLMLPTHCSWGCDNATLSCNPPEYMQNIYNILIIIGIIVFFIGLYAWAKRRK